jgi:hypothetical protein
MVVGRASMGPGTRLQIGLLVQSKVLSLHIASSKVDRTVQEASHHTKPSINVKGLWLGSSQGSQGIGSPWQGPEEK